MACLEILQNLRNTVERILWRPKVIPFCCSWDELHLGRLPILKIEVVEQNNSTNTLLTIEFANMERYENLPKYDDNDITDFSAKLHEAIRELLHSMIRYHDEYLFKDADDTEEEVMVFRDVQVSYYNKQARSGCNWSLGGMCGVYPLGELASKCGAANFENPSLCMDTNLHTDSVEKTRIAIHRIIWTADNKGEVAVVYDRGFLRQSVFAHGLIDVLYVLPNIITSTYQKVAREIFEEKGSEIHPISIIRTLTTARKIEFYTES